MTRRIALILALVASQALVGHARVIYSSGSGQFELAVDRATGPFDNITESGPFWEGFMSQQGGACRGTDTGRTGLGCINGLTAGMAYSTESEFSLEDPMDIGDDTYYNFLCGTERVTVEFDGYEHVLAVTMTVMRVNSSRPYMDVNGTEFIPELAYMDARGVETTREMNELSFTFGDGDYRRAIFTLEAQPERAGIARVQLLSEDQNNLCFHSLEIIADPNESTALALSSANALQGSTLVTLASMVGAIVLSSLW